MASSITNSPLNQSTSKQQYSFPKDPRFKHNRSIKYVDKFYDLPSIRQKRTTSLGFGCKNDVFNKSVLEYPGPQRYNINSQFNSEVKRKRGYSFGLGRDLIEYGSMLNKKKLNIEVPGPGNYQFKSTLTNISYSLQPKTSNIEEKLSFRESPGPGNYQNILSLQSNGKYPVSTFKSYGRTIINPTVLTPRRNQYETITPGPGRYECLNALTPSGKYPLSSMQNCKVRSFSISKRQQILNDSFYVPGPGTYRVFSEFGKNE